MFLIYQDYVYNNAHLLKVLAARYGAQNVAFADARDITHGILDHTVQAFFMPGGASRYVAAKLNGAGNANIKSYVAQGGVYIGLCAGAYYACRRTEWQTDSDNQIHVANELDLCPATAQGPVPAFTNGDGLNAYKTRLQLADGTHIDTFYRGGPTFAFADDTVPNSIEVLARYADLPGYPPAIVAGTHGTGRFVLSSPHIEIDSSILDMMTFDVVANRCADIAAMPDHNHLTTDYFVSLLDDVTGTHT